MERAVILTGGNIGDVRGNLAEARRLLREQVGKEITASTVMESEPWGFSDAPDFHNQVLVFDTELPPEELLAKCLSIERLLGRERDQEVAGAEPVENGNILPGDPVKKTYGSREIDIDILFYGDRIIDTPRLTVPHPLIQQREFVLRPLTEIMPGFVHPVLGKTMMQLLYEVQ